MVMNASAVHQAVKSFNYSFDYHEFDTAPETHSTPHVLGPIVKSLILLTTFILLIGVIPGVVYFAKSEGHRGFKWYSINLMAVNFLTAISITLNEKDLFFLLRDNLSAGLKARAKLYHFQIVELSNVVYLSTTVFLIVDSTARFVRESGTIAETVPASRPFLWLLVCLACDFIPFVYIAIQQEYFPYASVTPKPLALYHLLWWIAYGGAAGCFVTASLCCLKKRKAEEEYGAGGADPAEHAEQLLGL
ncbi:hypothetical protein M3Y99_00796600 [Aphelenchoides fujianensis]|nr:hypothetical protein M3Y99_00796600 [Aphelenchoides fujianensis]